MSTREFGHPPTPQHIPSWGGPFDGGFVSWPTSRHWVLHLPGDSREVLIGDDATCATAVYAAMLAYAHFPIRHVICGVYLQVPGTDRPARYLDLAERAMAQPSTAQQKYLLLAWFLARHTMLIHCNDWQTSRHSVSGAVDILALFGRDEGIRARAEEYRDFLIIDEATE